VQWLTNIGLSTLFGTVLGLVVWVAVGNPVIALILGLVVGIAFDLRMRRRKTSTPTSGRDGMETGSVKSVDH
jgi:hypothetical protein